MFKPFSLACQTGNAELMTVAIDCMGKLFTYNFWPKMEGDLLVTEPVKSSKDAVDDFEDTLPIVAYVVDMICNSFTGETTDESVQKQITRALLSAVTSEELDYCLHGSILLKAVRTTYNIFLLSKSTDVQNQAQQTVQLMTQHVFKRIKSAKLKSYKNAARRYATSNASTMPAEVTRTSVIEQIKTADVPAPSSELSLAAEGSAPTGPTNDGNISLSQVDEHSTVGQTVVPSITVTDFPSKVSKSENVSENVGKLEVATQPDNSEKYRNRFFSDAFKLIRTLLLLSIKAIPKPEGVVDLRSQPIRSKLLALHLIAAILSSHTDVFHMKAKCLMPLAKIDGIDADSFRFIHPVKESLVLLLIRNGTSVITPLFDAALQSFKILFTNSRQYLKEDLLVFFTDIVLPTLEGKDNAPWIQRHSLLKCLVELFEANGGKMLAEIYLNYDCDGKSVQENIWERLITIGSKIASNINGPVPKSNNIRLGYYVANSQFPILSTANLTCLSKEQVNEMLNHEGSSKVLGELAVRFLSIGCAKELWCWASPVKKDQPSAPAPEQAESATKKVETDDLEKFENMKTAKTNAIEGIQRFNANAKTGMEFLIRKKVIAQDTPAEIANYLFNTKELEPKPLGEYLGEGDEKNVKVMYCFLEKFKFKDLQFLEALRLLLKAFRLPGEAQKIDRIMLKFAELFVMENSDVFPSADVAYILAYSVIMLNTDLHNSHVKRKMSKQEFIKNTLGIKDCKDLTEEFLTSIYDQIEANEIKMHHKKEEADTTTQQEAVDSVDRSENLAVKTEKRLRNSGNGTTVNLKINEFVYATNIEHAKPMFEILCAPLISAMTDVFKKTDVPGTIKLCLDGIKYATYLGCLYELDKCKQDLLKTLTEFTMHSTNRKEDPSPKGWDAINLMIKIGLSQGEKLAICWKFVIDCISRLDRLDLLRESAEPKIELHASPTTESQLPLDLMVDKIFTTSEKLCNEAILYFVGALCDVSWEEIDSVLGQPRMFCLQKLVEISYYNMNRVRLEWANIWNILGRHFNQAGCHPDMSVAIFTLDQLRQLAIKFLDLQELPNFRFQREFLQPFDLILQNTAEMKIKEMCLICIQQIFQVKGSKLKSGWKTLLSAIDNAAKETNGTF